MPATVNLQRGVRVCVRDEETGAVGSLCQVALIYGLQGESSCVLGPLAL